MKIDLDSIDKSQVSYDKIRNRGIYTEARPYRSISYLPPIQAVKDTPRLIESKKMTTPGPWIRRTIYSYIPTAILMKKIPYVSAKERKAIKGTIVCANRVLEIKITKSFFKQIDCVAKMINFSSYFIDLVPRVVIKTEEGFPWQTQRIVAAFNLSQFI